jgi:phenylacetate 2-hydroxylase
MVSAGLDTVPGNLVMGLGYLSTPHGQELQQKCYDAIKNVYPNGEAWDACLREEKVPYITALVKEVLRFWTVIPISLPRVNIKDAVYNGATIPAGTTFFMVYLSPHLAPNCSIVDHMYRMPTQETTIQRISMTLLHSIPTAT